MTTFDLSKLRVTDRKIKKSQNLIPIKMGYITCGNETSMVIIKLGLLRNVFYTIKIDHLQKVVSSNVTYLNYCIYMIHICIKLKK